MCGELQTCSLVVSERWWNPPSWSSKDALMGMLELQGSVTTVADQGALGQVRKMAKSDKISSFLMLYGTF